MGHFWGYRIDEKNAEVLKQLSAEISRLKLVPLPTHPHPDSVCLAPFADAGRESYFRAQILCVCGRCAEVCFLWRTRGRWDGLTGGDRRSCLRLSGDEIAVIPVRDAAAWLGGGRVSWCSRALGVLRGLWEQSARAIGPPDGDALSASRAALPGGWTCPSCPTVQPSAQRSLGLAPQRVLASCLPSLVSAFFSQKSVTERVLAKTLLLERVKNPWKVSNFAKKWWFSFRSILFSFWGGVGAPAACGSSWSRDQIRGAFATLSHCTGLGVGPVSTQRQCWFLHPLCHSGSSQQYFLILFLRFRVVLKADGAQVGWRPFHTHTCGLHGPSLRGIRNGFVVQKQKPNQVFYLRNPHSPPNCSQWAFYKDPGGAPWARALPRPRAPSGPPAAAAAAVAACVPSAGSGV